MMRVVVALILAAALAGEAQAVPSAKEEQAFESLWSDNREMLVGKGIDRHKFKVIWYWNQLQYLTGVCSRYLTAVDALEIRNLIAGTEIALSPMYGLIEGEGVERYKEGLKDAKSESYGRDVCDDSMSDLAKDLSAWMKAKPN